MDILNQVSEVYRKIRNTMRFLLANTADFDPKTDMVSYENFTLCRQIHAGSIKRNDQNHS